MPALLQDQASELAGSRVIVNDENRSHTLSSASGRPPKVQVYKYGRQYGCADPRYDHRDDFVGLGRRDGIFYIRPEMEPKHNRQYTKEPLLID
jgi:hypothetical protein